jgi:hypothetical protein
MASGTFGSGAYAGSATMTRIIMLTTTGMAMVWRMESRPVERCCMGLKFQSNVEV